MHVSTNYWPSKCTPHGYPHVGLICSMLYRYNYVDTRISLQKLSRLKTNSRSMNVCLLLQLPNYLVVLESCMLEDTFIRKFTVNTIVTRGKKFSVKFFRCRDEPIKRIGKRLR